TDQRIAFVRETRKAWHVHPALLNELELPFWVAVQANEEQPAIDAVVFAWIRDPRAVGTSAAKDPVGVYMLKRVRIAAQERITRIRPSHMGTERTVFSVCIVSGVAELVGVGERCVWSTWTEGDRRPVRPTSNRPRGEPVSGTAQSQRFAV